MFEEFVREGFEHEGFELEELEERDHESRMRLLDDNWDKVVAKVTGMIDRHGVEMARDKLQESISPIDEYDHFDLCSKDSEMYKTIGSIERDKIDEIIRNALQRLADDQDF